MNIVRLAIECMDIADEKARIEKFFEKLDEVMEVTARQLCNRYDFQKTALAKQFPLLMSSLWVGSENLGPNDTIESVINQGTLGIGFIGLAECLIALVGKHHGESAEAQKLGLEIVGRMRVRANEFRSVTAITSACWPLLPRGCRVSSRAATARISAS